MWGVKGEANASNLFNSTGLMAVIICVFRCGICAREDGYVSSLAQGCDVVLEQALRRVGWDPFRGEFGDGCVRCDAICEPCAAGVSFDDRCGDCRESAGHV